MFYSELIKMQSETRVCDLNKTLTLETGNRPFKEFAERIKTYIEDQVSISSHLGVFIYKCL